MAGNEALTGWMERYLRAWNSNAPEDITALFSPDADYYTAPYATPWHGHREIVEQWRARPDEAGGFEFRWEPLAVTPEIAVVRARTTYPSETYSNLWTVRLEPDGRCRQFVEWWMLHPRNGAPAAG